VAPIDGGKCRGGDGTAAQLTVEHRRGATRGSGGWLEAAAVPWCVLRKGLTPGWARWVRLGHDGWVAAGPRTTCFWADVVEIQRKKRWASLKFCAEIKEDRIWAADMAFKFYSRFLIQIKEF
jgi:hypothetical protein